MVRCPVCSMPFHLDRSADNSTDATSSAGFTGHAGDRTPSSHSSCTHAAIPAPRSNGSLLPLHPHMLVPPGPASGRSTSGPWDDESPMVQSAAAVAELFQHEPWLKRRLHLPVSVGDLLPALRGEPVGKAAWMQLVARYRLPQSMLLHRLRAESASHALGAGRSSRRGAPLPHPEIFRWPPDARSTKSPSQCAAHIMRFAEALAPRRAHCWAVLEVAGLMRHACGMLWGGPCLCGGVRSMAPRAACSLLAPDTL